MRTHRRHALLAAAVLAGAFLGSPAHAVNVTWEVDGSGLWTTVTNWSSSPFLPGITSDVIINRPAGEFLITLNSGAHSINSLLTTERITFTAGTLTLAGLMDIRNTFTLSGGTLTHANITTSGAGSVVITTGALDNVTLSSSIGLVGNQNVVIRNGLALNASTLSLTGGVGYPYLYINGSQSITGTGTLLMDGNSGYYANISDSGASTLTLGPSISVRTGNGSSTAVAVIDTSGLINQGLISSEFAGKSLAINSANWSSSGTLQAIAGGVLNLAGTWSNTGTIIVNTGILNLGGSFTTAGLNLPGLTRTGGAINITGALNNNNAVLPLTAATGNFTLAAGTITGGTVTGAGGAQLLSTTGVLDNVSLAVNLPLTAAQSVTIRNNLNLNGATLSLTAGIGYPLLYVSGSQSVTGAGTILLDGNSGYYASLTSTGTSTLTLGPTNSVRTGSGNSTTLGIIDTTGLINQGLISSESSGKLLAISSLNWSSSGVLQAINGGILTLNGNWSNTGSMTLNASTLNLGGAFTTAGLNIPTLFRTGGIINITGALNNNAAVLPLTAATGNFTLAGGTITGGTITATGGATLLSTTGSLDGVTLATNLLLTASQYVVLRNGLTFNGATISLTGGVGYPFIYIQGSQSILGTGTILMDGNIGYYSNISSNSGPSTLTLGPSIIVRTGLGDSPTLGVIDTAGLINQGLISSQSPGKILAINAMNWSNSGVLQAINGGILTLTGNWSNTGTMTLNASTFNLGGSFTTAGLNLPTLARTGGVINITGALNNSAAVLPLTAATGNFILVGGTITGGTITASGGAQLLSTSGVLDNVSLVANLPLTGSQNVTIRNNLNLDGATLSLTGGIGYPILYISGSQSITGTGTILLDGNSGYYGNISSSGASTITLGPAVAVRTGNGNSTTVGNIDTSGLINQGLISSESSGKLLTINVPNWSSSGRLQAINGGILTLNGNWSNTGTMTLNAATINLGGAFTTAGLNLPTLVRNGGTMNITGALNNTNAILPFTAATGDFTLAGGTITGGTITGAGGATLLSTTGILDAVTLATNVPLTGSQSVTIRNGLTLNGATLTLTGGIGYPVVYASGSQSVAGNGTFVLDGNTGYYAVLSQVGASTLTLGPSIAVRTGAGNSPTVGSIESAGFISQGILETSTAGKILVVSSPFFSSSGTVTGPGNLTFNPGVSSFSGTFSVSGLTTLNSNHATISGPVNAAGNFAGAGSLTITSGAALTSDGVRLNALSIAGTHFIRDNGSNVGASLITTLTIAGGTNAWTGKLDVTNNAFIVQANSTNKSTLFSTLQNQIFTGRAGGTWTGNGITSSTLPATPNTSLALVDNADLHLVSFRGQPVNDNSLIILQARYGDANLDSKVDALDLNLLAAHWNSPSGERWSTGDFTSDGAINAFDLNLLAANWQFNSGGSLDAALAATGFGTLPVPEPTSLALLAPGALLLIRRARTRSPIPNLTT